MKQVRAVRTCWLGVCVCVSVAVCVCVSVCDGDGHECV